MLIVIIVIVAVAAIFSLGQSMFGGNKPSKEKINYGKQAITQTESTNAVRMSVRGPIVASENFHSYDITISPNGRNMTTYVGYVGKQVQSKQYTNDRQAYEQLAYALDRAGMMNDFPLTGSANDMRGICATGYVYQFEVLSQSNSIQSLWTTSCRSVKGSLTATRSVLSDLFQKQIPDYAKLVDKINLY